MNFIKMTIFKLIRTYWIVIMVALPILYGALLYWYLGRYDNPKQMFYSYTLYYNCVLPCGIALLISLYTQYEEQIGHFNHLLELPRRRMWLLNMMFISWFSVGVSTGISAVPLWFLIGNSYNQYIVYFLLLTTLFSLPFIILLWFIALKVNVSLSLGIGIFFSLFLTLFGANSLGDTIWMYVPFLYGTRYLYVMNISFNVSLFIFSMFLLLTSILLSIVTYWYKRWEGRTINE